MIEAMTEIKQRENFRAREALVDSDRLVFVFTAMGTRLEQYSLFIRQLNKKGYSVVIYDYPTELVLEAEFEEYDKMYDGVKADAYERIKRLNPGHIYTYGMSMGTVLAGRLTRETPEIQHVVMCMTYGDITSNMMTSPATEKTRKTMQARGLTVDDLRAAVKPYDPIANVAGLKNKKVWLHLARRDKILDYTITVKTKETFEANIKNFKYTESKYLGHYGAGAKHMLKVGELDRFYKS